MSGTPEYLAFQPQARLLVLLGDQLIRDPGIAVFELVKNAYDADATRVDIVLRNITSPDEGEIIVTDNGCGMSLKTIRNVWMKPATSHRAPRKDKRKPTPVFGRLPLGEKGIGRFAVHKLGREIILVTRQEGHKEVVVRIDWRKFEEAEDVPLEKLTIPVVTRSPQLFSGKDSHGTRITIRGLRNSWSRGQVRELHRAVTSICSPFGGPDNFQVHLRLDPDPDDWLKGLLDVSDVLRLAPFVAHCEMEGDRLSYGYEFSPPGEMRKHLRPRKTRKQGLTIVRKIPGGRGRTEPVDLGPGEPGPDDPVRIGPVKLELYIYDLDPVVLAHTTTDRRGLREFLRHNGGIRVYRDGVRVYDYGEPENDWLGLGTRRVNVPARRISNNIVLGAVLLDRAKSSSLVEKTNREGFVENEAYLRLRDAVLFALEQIETERQVDKKRIRELYGRQKGTVLDAIDELRDCLKDKGLLDELDPLLKQVEGRYQEWHEKVIVAASTGLNLSVVLHEVEKGIRELITAVKRGVKADELEVMAEHLEELLDGLTYLLRRSGKRQEKASDLIEYAVRNLRFRLQYHDIELVNGMERGCPDFKIKCHRRFIIASLMNLIDNSIYWLDVRKPARKRLYIGTTLDLDGPAIVVADNGPGFMDPPEILVEPYVTRKPEGMGLGLFLADQTMRAYHKGSLYFPRTGEISLPRGINGAVVALVFGDGNGSA